MTQVLVEGGVPLGLADCAVDILDCGGPLQIAERSGRILYRSPALRVLLAEAAAPLPDRLTPEVVGKLSWSHGRLRLTETFVLSRRVRTFSLRFEPIPAGRVVVFFEETTHSTELLRNFKRYRDRSQELLSIVSDWVWEIDEQWRLTYVVSRAGDLALSDLGGRDLLSLGHFVDLPDYPATRPPNRRTRAPFQDRPFQLTAPGLGDRKLLLSAVPVFTDNDGVFEGFRGSGRDITLQHSASESARAYRIKLETTLADLLAANEKLDAALVEVRAADQAKSAFLSMMGHELRTPLNAVIGFADLLKGEVFGPMGNSRYVGYAADILTSGKHLLSLINDILAYVKMEAGDVELQGEPIDIAETLAIAVRFVSEQARNGRLDLVFDCPAPLIFVTNERNLLQILLNLLSNAVKFTREKGTISLKAELDDNGLTVWVRDTGVGIPADRLPHVLKPFQQADQRLEREFGGAGLGLPLANGLAARHGGTLDVESIVGQGTVVTVKLPHSKTK